MKRLILVFTTVLMVGTVFAQTSKQVNFNSLEKKLDRSNANIEHEKRNLRFQTWLQRGELMLEIYDAMTLNATTGMSIAEFNVIVGFPKQQSEKVIDDKTVTEYVMDRVNFYFLDGQIEYWVFTNLLVDDPLNEAKNCFLKAKELDDKGRGVSEIQQSLSRLKYMYIAEGSNLYAQKEYKTSSAKFATAIEIGENPLVNFVDTIIIYYAGLSAQVGEDFETAIEFYKKALEYDYPVNGSVYYNTYEAFSSLGKAEEGLKFLEQGFVKFPKNQSILYALINYYIAMGDDPSLVLKYLHQAMETDPTEPSLYFAEGTLHDKLENTIAAEAAYKKAIELDPNFFDAIFNLGALYFNSGVKLLEEANKVPAREMDKYDDLMAKSNVEFRKSIPYMEKAYQIIPNSKPVIESLRNLYFRYRNESEEIQKKYEEINEVFNNLEE